MSPAQIYEMKQLTPAQFLARGVTTNLLDFTAYCTLEPFAAILQESVGQYGAEAVAVHLGVSGMTVRRWLKTPPHYYPRIGYIIGLATLRTVQQAREAK
jgi:response regulator of citrate/malate metabolism